MSRQKNGFSIIEVIVAVSVLMVVLMAVGKTMQMVERVPRIGAIRLTAAQSAQEAVEALILIQDDVFGLAAGEYRLVADGNSWLLASGGEIEVSSQPVIRRKIEIENARRDANGQLDAGGTEDAKSKLATVTTSYEERGQAGTVVLSILLTNWNEL